MPAVEAYLYSNCTSCKKADALLSESGVEVTRRDIFKEKLSADEIRSLFARARLTVGTAVSTRSRPYADLQLAGKELSDDEIIGLMAAYPALLKRPIIVKDGQSVVGFKRDAILALIRT